MTNDQLRQFAMLQLEKVLDYEIGQTADRLWAALYCVQAMDEGPRPADFLNTVMNAAVLDEVE